MFYVHHETLIDSAILTRRVAAEIEAEQSRLAREVDELFSGGWSGAAASSFAAAIARWDEGAAHVRPALDRMGADIGSAQRAFQSTDAHDSAEVRRAGSGLNL